MKHAAEGLVEAAKKAADNAAEVIDPIMPTSTAASIAEELMAQEKILQKERELQRAREQLVRLRKQKYEKQ